MVVLGLGSNIGDRLKNLNAALKEISVFCKLKEISRVYSSDAQLLENAPKDWNKEFLNIAVKIETELSAPQILTKIKEAEGKLGREKRNEKWSPRLIDIDILCMGNLVMEGELSVPHKHLLERPFALWPLTDVAPEWQYPVAGKNFGKAAKDLAKNFGDFPACTTQNGNLYNTMRTGQKLGA